jgi:hypothetical protein
MLGSATFTIVMSSSNMNVVTQTAISVQRRVSTDPGSTRGIIGRPLLRSAEVE